MLALVPQVMKQAMDRYEDMFVQRGSAYDRAMRRLPQARAAEFAQVIARADMRSGQVVADVPAGGGYLRGFLPAGVAWVGHEPCASFQGGQHGASSSGRPLLPFPWEDASMDRVICLAGLHHQEDKIPFHSEARRVLRPSGRYVLSDVPADSPVAAFLDGFIGAHNSTGHSGTYLDGRTQSELSAAGLRIVSDELVRFLWIFRDVSELGEFCHGLFDLRTASPRSVAEAAAEQLGVEVVPEGVGLRWELRTVVATTA